MFRKQYIQFAILSTFAALLLLLTSAGAAARVSNNQDTTTSTDEEVEVAGVQNCGALPRFHQDDFSEPTEIDNKWLPLVPGTQFILEGRANRTGEVLPHQVVFTITDLTKVINDVRTIVVWDRDINDGQLEEEELAFFAQDDDGNVWSLGEYPEEYEDGEFAGAPSTWIIGQKRAEPGIAMLAEPQLGMPGYQQGKALAIDFLDCAQVFAEHQTICVPVNCYQNVLVTDEWSPLDPDSGHQRKFYAPNVGNIQVGAVNDPEDETLVLVELLHLNPKTLAEARKAALMLDKHAYKVSDVYPLTPSAKRWRDDYYTLIVDTVGNGTVTLNPPDGVYAAGTVVQLSVTPETGSTFTGWSGAANDATDSISVAMDDDKEVTAIFIAAIPLPEKVYLPVIQH